MAPRDMTNEELAWRFRELEYRQIEVAIDPGHPASRANGARWKRELEAVTRECDRRGMLERRK